MREIKFRVWDINNKAYHYFGECFLAVNWLGFKSETARYNNPEEKLLENFIIQQFTGLKDKNSKEIYEGDIVKLIKGDGYGWYSQNNFEIKFGEYSCPFGEGNIGDDEYGFYALGPLEIIVSISHSEEIFKIISNIFENKELIDE